MLFQACQAAVIDVFHKLHSFFVSIYQGQAVVLWVHCQELEGTRVREKISFKKLLCQSLKVYSECSPLKAEPRATPMSCNSGRKLESRHETPM